MRKNKIKPVFKQENNVIYWNNGEKWLVKETLKTKRQAETKLREFNQHGQR